MKLLLTFMHIKDYHYLLVFVSNKVFNKFQESINLLSLQFSDYCLNSFKNKNVLNYLDFMSFKQRFLWFLRSQVFFT